VVAVLQPGDSLLASAALSHSCADANAGMAAITGLCDRSGVIGALDTAVAPARQRDGVTGSGYETGELLTGIAAAQPAAEDLLAGLDRQRADTAGQQLAPVPG